MSPGTITFFAFCVGLALLQVVAALPWLLAIDHRLRSRLRNLSTLGTGAAVAAGIGLGWGFFLHAHSDIKVLESWGRFYMSLLHLQLGLDLLVAVFVVLLLAWPKGGAVAISAFREGIRQPMYWLLTLAALFLMLISPLIPYFTFGEDLKMVRELCFAFTMLAAALFGVIDASTSVSEEIEGRTAITLMSKPVSRRQFLLGKFLGIFMSALAMTIFLGWVLVWVVLFKRWYDNPNPSEPLPVPAWVQDLVSGWLAQSSAGDLLRGIGFWIADASEALPHLVISFCQVMVLIAVAVALATRLPMMVTMTACFVIYFLGHLTPIMTEVTRQGYALVYFVAQLFDTILPGLDLFDVGTAIVRDAPLPIGGFLLYTLNVTLYAVIYTAIALLFGLILFEDRDLA